MRPEALWERLADQLAETDDLSPTWRAVFQKTPRHLFAPARGWAVPDGGLPGYRIDIETDPDAWWRAVYSDAGIITQEAAEAYLTWIGWGRPERSRFGLSVTPEGQHLWLDTPERVVTPVKAG